MRKPSVFTSRRSELDIKMTPMIDVVFLLLIFFVWTASFQVVEHILPSSVSAVTGTSPIDPNQPVPEIEDFEDVVVRVVSENGRVVWRVNDQPVANLSDLKRQLQTIASIKKDAPVILHPDPGVSLGDVIDVYEGFTCCLLSVIFARSY
jgi:biopolymer transport protein ExbD